MDLNNQQAHPTDVKREVQKEQALTLRIARYSYRAIARELGISATTAHELVTEALNETRAENEEAAQELRRAEVALCDELTMRLWPKAPKEGEPAPALDPRTADTILRIAERRAKLLGLDAPQRWEGSGPGGGPFPVVGGPLDLSKLSLDQLRHLEQIYDTAGAAKLPAGAVAALPNVQSEGKNHA